MQTKILNTILEVWTRQETHNKAFQAELGRINDELRAVKEECQAAKEECRAAKEECQVIKELVEELVANYPLQGDAKEGLASIRVGRHHLGADISSSQPFHRRLVLGFDDGGQQTQACRGR